LLFGPWVTKIYRIKVINRMKVFSFLTFLIIIGWSHGQSCRDSILTARQAYLSKRYDEAYRSYSRINKAMTNKTDITSEKAQSAYRNGKYDLAADHYQQGLKQVPSAQAKSQLYYNLGNASLKQKRYKEAIKAYQNALKANPFNEEARYNLSQALRKQQQSKDKQNQKDQDKTKQPPKDNKDKKDNGKAKKERSNPKKHESGNKPKNDSPGNKQQKNAIDRILNKLMKDEAATKRKLNQAKVKRNGSPINNAFDW